MPKSSTPPPLTTRKPTGLPNWPTALLAGVEGSGKSVRAALASASTMVHRTFWIGCGEDDPDEYGVYPDVRFEIVEHDGTYRGILAACAAASAQERGPNGEPNLIVLDSGSRLWALLTELAQETANARALRKAQRSQRTYSLPEDGAPISPDLWNNARDRWYHVLDTLRYDHEGPVIITSKLKMTTVFENGEPTKLKEWDQKAQFDLGYDVGLYVQMRASYPAQDDWLIRVKSARFKHPVDGEGKPKPTALPSDWSLEGLWSQLGLGSGQASQQATHHGAVKSGDFDSEEQRRNDLLEQIKARAEAQGLSLHTIADDWAASHNGQSIRQTTDFGGLELLRDDLDPPPASGGEDAAPSSDAERLRAAAEANRAPEDGKQVAGPHSEVDGRQAR